jgi:hypothetical protein
MAEPSADTANSTGRLMIAVFGEMADVERDLIRRDPEPRKGCDSRQTGSDL